MLDPDMMKQICVNSQQTESLDLNLSHLLGDRHVIMSFAETGGMAFRPELDSWVDAVLASIMQCNHTGSTRTCSELNTLTIGFSHDLV
jgi:hypothetical protein